MSGPPAAAEVPAARAVEPVRRPASGLPWRRLVRRPALLGGAAVATAALVTALFLGDDLLAALTAEPSASPPAPTPVASTSGTDSPAPSGQVPRSAPLGPEVITWPRSRDGNWDIALLDAGTGEEIRRLTRSRAEDTVPVVSRDRQSIIYSRRSSDGAGTLRVMAADGTGDRPLLTRSPSGCGPLRRPAWAPGDQLAVVCPSSDDPAVSLLKLVSVGGGLDVELDRGRLGDPTFCAGGTQVVYWRTTGERDGGALYRVAARPGARPERLTDGTDGQDADPACSLDGSQIAFRRGPENARQIFTARYDGTRLTDEPAQVTDGDNDQDPSWSPDGRRLAYKTGPSSRADVGLLDLRTQTSEVLSTASDPDTAPSWTSR